MRIGISGWNYTPWRGVFIRPSIHIGANSNSRVERLIQSRSTAHFIRCNLRRAFSAGTEGPYIYFDNDAKVHAPLDAERLRERLG
jgi:uncharacterized protein YecE (DUF72 family)